MSFAPSFFYLQQETLLAEATLASGLTSIRKGNLSDRGSLYRGFFEVSIGVERLFKILLVVEHMVAERLRAPTNDWLRSKGHDLLGLYESIRALESSVDVMPPEPLNTIDQTIMRFMSRFARGSRYYNLDALSGGARGDDPLSEWGEILERILAKDVPAKKRARLQQQARSIGQALAPISMVVAHDLKNYPLDHIGIFEVPALQNAAAPYAVARIVGILRPARHLLNDAGKRGYAATKAAGDSRMCIPDFVDFLLFLETGGSDAVRKKRWP